MLKNIGGFTMAFNVVCIIVDHWLEITIIVKMENINEKTRYTTSSFALLYNCMLYFTQHLYTGDDHLLNLVWRC